MKERVLMCLHDAKRSQEVQFNPGANKKWHFVCLTRYFVSDVINTVSCLIDLCGNVKCLLFLAIFSKVVVACEVF